MCRRRIMWNPLVGAAGRTYLKTPPFSAPNLQEKAQGADGSGQSRSLGGQSCILRQSCDANGLFCNQGQQLACTRSRQLLIHFCQHGFLCSWYTALAAVDYLLKPPQCLLSPALLFKPHQRTCLHFTMMLSNVQLERFIMLKS
jgi:hypothetical protein